MVSLICMNITKLVHNATLHTGTCNVVDFDQPNDNYISELMCFSLFQQTKENGLRGSSMKTLV